MARKAILVAFLVTIACAAVAKQGRYPHAGIKKSQPVGLTPPSVVVPVETGCTLPFTLPCTLG